MDLAYEPHRLADFHRSPTTALPDGVHTWETPTFRVRVLSRADAVSYELREVCGVFSAPDLAELGARQHVIIGSRAADQYGAQLKRYYSKHRVAYTWHPVDTRHRTMGGEPAKTLATYHRLLHEMLPVLGRRDLIVAVGGGAVLDLTAFVAATADKGHPTAALPLSGIGYVDAAIGPKHAVNLTDGPRDFKNNPGLYAAFDFVLWDRALLATAPALWNRAAIPEILKMAVIEGEPDFSEVERYGPALVDTAFQCDESAPILRRAAMSMLGHLWPNLREGHLVRDVDLGHEVAALELDAGITHGVVVGWGLRLAAQYGHDLGYCSSDDLRRIHGVLDSVSLKPWHSRLTPGYVLACLEGVRRTRGGDVNMPVIHGIGTVAVHPSIDADVMERSVTALQASR